MILKLKLLALIFVFAVSCKQNGNNKTEREGEPDVYNVEESNSQMNNAIKEANAKINDFKVALESKNPDYEFFAIKQRFETSGGGEHMWIQDIKMVNSDFVGILGNEPLETNEVKIGDSIKIDKSRISDWMYFDKGIVKGAYTIRVLRDELSPGDKKTFDYENGLNFD